MSGFNARRLINNTGGFKALTATNKPLVALSKGHCTSDLYTTSQHLAFPLAIFLTATSHHHKKLLPPALMQTQCLNGSLDRLVCKSSQTYPTTTQSPRFKVERSSAKPLELLSDHEKEA
jgi:hypothetical protein